MRYGNCLVWAVLQRLRFGGKLRVVRSPVFPLIPRASWSSARYPGVWLRYHDSSLPSAPTCPQKWMPVRALVFAGRVIVEPSSHATMAVRRAAMDPQSWRLAGKQRARSAK
jgi:hypothetical protein